MIGRTRLKSLCSAATLDRRKLAKPPIGADAGRRPPRMSSSAVAAAARTVVASAVCFGVATAFVRLMDERAGRFVLEEAGFESDADSRYPLSISRDTAPCTREAFGTVLVVLSILITLEPFRDVFSCVTRARNVLLGRVRSGRSGTSYTHDAGFPESAFGEKHEGVPNTTPALDALVTDDDIDHFLSELKSAPTEREVLERHGLEEEVVSGVSGCGEARLEERRLHLPRRNRARLFDHKNGTESAAAAVATAEAAASGWSLVSRGDTGNGTTFRMLKRNGPAPGTGLNGTRGLTQFRLEMVMEGVSASQLARVQMNDVIRNEWDNSLLHADHIAKRVGEAVGVPNESGENSIDDDSGNGTELAFWRMKFPMPLAPREYLFVRRRWRASADNGWAYFGVTKDATGCRDADALLRQNGVARGGGYRVRRIFSGQRIRDVQGFEEADQVVFHDPGGVHEGAPSHSPANSTTQAPTGKYFTFTTFRRLNAHTRLTFIFTISGPGPYGQTVGSRRKNTGAAELVSVYHEDSGVPAAVICLGACKGLMPYMRGLEAAARSGAFKNGAVTAIAHRNRRKFAEQRHHGRVRRRLFGDKPHGKAGEWHGRPSFWPLRRFSLSRGDANSKWFPHAARGQDVTGENEPGRVHGRRRALVRSALSRLKKSIIHRTTRRPTIGHDHVHAVGRRRRLMVRAAGLVAVMSRIAKNR
jgi:hypothetical protein